MFWPWQLQSLWNSLGLLTKYKIESTRVMCSVYSVLYLSVMASLRENSICSLFKGAVTSLNDVRYSSTWSVFLRSRLPIFVTVRIGSGTTQTYGPDLSRNLPQSKNTQGGQSFCLKIEEIGKNTRGVVRNVITKNQVIVVRIQSVYDVLWIVNGEAGSIVDDGFA